MKQASESRFYRPGGSLIFSIYWLKEVPSLRFCTLGGRLIFAIRWLNNTKAEVLQARQQAHLLHASIEPSTKIDALQARQQFYQLNPQTSVLQTRRQTQSIVKETEREMLHPPMQQLQVRSGGSVPNWPGPPGEGETAYDSRYWQ